MIVNNSVGTILCITFSARGNFTPNDNRLKLLYKVLLSIMYLYGVHSAGCLYLLFLLLAYFAT